jgi:CheY-like chemotaxis protein
VPYTILVVDDDYSALEILSFLLEREGYQILTASDGEEGLARLHERRPDLVVTDYWMPKLDGIGFCERMREDERYRDIPVIMMSAAAREGPKPPGVVAIFGKPLLFPALLSAVKQILDEKKRRT